MIGTLWEDRPLIKYMDIGSDCGHAAAGIMQAIVCLDPLHHFSYSISRDVEGHPCNVGSTRVGAQRNQASIKDDELLLRARGTTEHEPRKARCPVDLDK